ncbi:hypothetical protein Leryth_015497 [Lithospermum erythrorhizon]|nr:hypothetical protein Leryth_015497 [Lithospermum erythrorhizon]
MQNIGRRSIHYLHKLNAENVPKDLIERAKLKGPAFAPPRIREAIWCGSTNSTTEEGKELSDPRILTDVGDVPVQEIRDCGVGDDKLMSIISESVKLVMEEAPLRPLVLGGDHSYLISCLRTRAFVAMVGIRSINKEGREQGKKFGVELYEMRTFSRDQRMLEHLKLGEGVKGVYVSIDVDCLDPAFAPGMSHIEPGGLSFHVMNILHNPQGDIVAADVVEFNPQRDTVDGMAAMVAAKLVRELTAKISK